MTAELVVALSMILSASPGPHSDDLRETAAPAAGPDARYCLRVEAATGTRLETVQCWTREEWAALEVDVDREWAREGVRVIS